METKSIASFLQSKLLEDLILIQTMLIGTYVDPY